jgi:hypothetical protein
MRRLLAFVWLAFTVVAVACSGNDATAPSTPNEPAAATPTVPPPSFATADNGAGLSITTDKDDYAPGDTVWFTGAGWQPGDTLEIVLADEPATHDPHTWRIPVNETGGFRDSTYVVDVGDLGVTFTLTATSRANPAQSLTVQFTDGNPGVPFVAVGQSPNPVTPGSPATYTIEINYSGTNALCTVDLSATPTASPAWPAPPPGGFFAFSPASVTGRGTGGGGTAINPQSTLTVTIPAGMAANTYQFTVTRTRNQQPGETCQGSVQASVLINLVVAAPANAVPSAPADLAQFKSNGATTIATGGATNEATVVLKGTVTDPDAGNTVKLQVEVRPVGTAFSNTSTAESGLLASGSTASVTVTPLAEDSHHWQARAVDNSGAASAWVAFGGNAETQADFRVDLTPPTVTINQAAGQADPTNASPINFTVVFSEAVSDVATSDITPSGTAGATTATVTGGPTTYSVAVSGMANDGTVIASVAAGVAHDAAGNANVASTSIDNTVTYDATPPVVSNVQASPNPSNGAGNVVLTATATDALTKVTSAEYNIDGGGFAAMTAQDGGFDELAEDVTVTISAATFTEGSHAVCVRASDEATNRSGNAAACTTLIVDRTPPVISNLAVNPNPVAVNTPLTISATFTDALTNVTGAEYSLGGTAGPWVALPSAGGSYGDSQTENGSVMFSLPNADVLDVCVRSTDQVGNTNQTGGTNPIQCIFLAVYDPSAGFVTGGGWINSPPGACRFGACQDATIGKATFGFVSKYHKGADIPTGNTEFQFHAGNLNFKSQSYDWLVVNGNSGRAQYRGVGPVNGGGNYGFMLTAFDGSTDRFRMKIWDVSSGTVIYDNQMNQPDTSTLATELGGGSIIIHVPKK